MVSQQLSLLFFWLAIAIYICAFLFYAARIKLPSKAYMKWATIFIVSGLISHTGAIIFRYLALGGFSNTGLFDMFLFISWFVVVEALVVEVWARVKILGFYASLLAVILLLVGWNRYEVPAAIAKDIRLYYITAHVGLIFIALAAFLIAAGAATFYLLQERQLKQKKLGALQKFLPSLQVLDETTYRSIVSGFIVFTVAIVLGFSGVSKLWDGWDTTTVVGSISIWGVYMVYLLTRFKMGWEGKKSSYLAIAGILPIIAILIIVPLLADLHIYQ